MLFKLSDRVEWRDELLMNAGSFSLLKRLRLIFFLLFEDNDPDDEETASLFEYLN